MRDKQRKQRVIRASEIGEYSYCSRAWWYRHVVKLAPPHESEQRGRFARGQEAHARHGRSVSRALTLRAVGISLLMCGLLLLTIAVLLNVR